jgi:hypothetical protein
MMGLNRQRRLLSMRLRKRRKKRYISTPYSVSVMGVCMSVLS